MEHYLLREACFACTTPYQILGAISITLGYKLDADLYIFGMFPNYDEIAARLNKYRVFANIYSVDCSKIRVSNRIEVFKQMLFANETVSFFLPENVAYSYYYSSSNAIVKTIMHQVLLSRYPSMQKILYEDGIGTYTSRSHIFQSSLLMKISNTLLGRNLDAPEKTNIVANYPQLVDLPKELANCYIGKMPMLPLNETTINMLEDVFSVSKERKIKEKYIIFDTYRFNAKRTMMEELSLLDQCYTFISSIVGKSNIICKPHPRSNSVSKADLTHYLYQEIPMEVLYASMQDLNERVLIAHTSSAVFTPKILFDKEPKIICLHNIVNNNRASSIFEEVYKKFKSIYSEQSKLVAPKSFDELEKELLV